jgi:hypothetical protein
LRLLDDESRQDGEDLQRCLRHVLLPFGDDETLFLLRRRPVLLASGQLGNTIQAYDKQ